MSIDEDVLSAFKEAALTVEGCEPATLDALLLELGTESPNAEKVASVFRKAIAGDIA